MGMEPGSGEVKDQAEPSKEVVKPSAESAPPRAETKPVTVTVDLEKRQERIDSLLETFRLSRTQGPVDMDPNDRELILKKGEEAQERLAHYYKPGFGIFPASEPSEPFYNQVWSRDFAHASGNYFALVDSNALTDSLETIFRHQTEKGMLPLRVEKEYALVKFIPVVGPRLAKAAFDLIEGKIKHRTERPVYEGQDFSGAEDTIPAVLITAGEAFIASEKGRQFAKDHFDQLEKAVDFFRGKTDPEDGLAVITKLNPDWADSLIRPGKLGNINVLWARSLRMMEYMARQLGHTEKADSYKDEFKKVRQSVMDKLYNKEEGYFRTAEGEDRVDTVGSIFGSLYLLSPSEAVRVEETLEKRVRHSSGLKNFDPPYPPDKIFSVYRMIGHDGYHNEFVWPWVTCQNIQVKIKIALQHPDDALRNQYQKEAVNDLVGMAKLFTALGGAYEIVRPDKPEPATTPLYRNPPKNLMGSLAAYQGAFLQMKDLKWI